MNKQYDVDTFIPRLYTSADVAHALGESRACVFNWIRRYDDTPLPAFEYVAKRYDKGVVVAGLWDSSGLRAWHEWRDQHRNNRRKARASKAAKLRAEAERLESDQ